MNDHTHESLAARVASMPPIMAAHHTSVHEVQLHENLTTLGPVEVSAAVDQNGLLFAELDEIFKKNQAWMQ